MKTLFGPQIKGFKYLFYKSSQNKETFSYLKSLLFFIYLLTMITAFLQFSLRIGDLQIQCPTQIESINPNNDCQIIPNVFGQIFYVFNFLILLLALIITFQSHLSKMKLKITSILSLVIQTVIMVIVLALFLVLFVEPTAFYDAYHDFASGILIFWLVIIEPVLFFNSLILLLGIISEDYPFNGYKKNTRVFLTIDFIIIIVLIIFSALILGFYRNKTDYSILPGVIIDYENVEIFLVGASLIFFSIIAMISYYFIKEKITNAENVKIQKGIIPYVVLFGILFLLIRGISGVFTWDNTLRSISSIIDITFLIFIIIIGINGQINLPDSEVNGKKFRYTRPLTWLYGIPKYAKVLLLFFLGGMMFYYSLEQEAISVLLDAPNYLASERISAVVLTLIFGYISVFLNFKPRKVPINHVGPIKFFQNSIQDIFQKNK